MPGLRFKPWPLYGVQAFDWVQVPPGRIGLVIAQVGEPIPTGAKSAVYKSEFGNFADVHTFLDHGGQRGVQRPVLPPGTTAPIHPIGFIVVTGDEVFGKIVSDSAETSINQVDPSVLSIVQITPQGDRDVVGVVTTLEGPPSGGIASRIGGFSDVAGMEASGTGLGDADHPGGAAVEERPPRQLSGLPGVPRRRWLHRPPTRPAPVRVLPAQPLPRQGRAARDARRAPRRGRRDQVVRRVADRGHVGRGVQVRLDRRPRSPGHLVRTAAHGQVHAQPADLRGRDRPDLDPHPELVGCHQRGAQPRRPALAHRRQEQGSVHVQHRPAGADPRARHPRPEGDQHGRHDAEPRQRGAPLGGRQLLPQQAADAGRDRVHREARRGAGRR